jgi:hypothetical protein
MAVDSPVAIVGLSFAGIATGMKTGYADGILQILLMIGGIESNPGPIPDEVSFFFHCIVALGV